MKDPNMCFMVSAKS